MRQYLDYSRHYRKWHPDTPEHLNSMINFYQRILSPYLPEQKDSCILDLGCGMGFSILALHSIGYKNVEGIDVDEKQVQFCLQKGLNVKIVDDSIEFLRKNSSNYDLVLALDLIEHIPQELELDFVKAVYQALRYHGKIICTVPNANSTLATRWRYIDWTHYQSFTEHSLDFLLYNAGFENIKIHELEFFTKPKLSVLGHFNFTFYKNSLLIYLHWTLLRMVRLHRRLEMIAELGFNQGKAIPLSLNLLAVAEKV